MGSTKEGGIKVVATAMTPSILNHHTTVVADSDKLTDYPSKTHR